MPLSLAGGPAASSRAAPTLYSLPLDGGGKGWGCRGRCAYAVMGRLRPSAAPPPPPIQGEGLQCDTSPRDGRAVGGGWSGKGLPQLCEIDRSEEHTSELQSRVDI